jgi:hypothetical protein
MKTLKGLSIILLFTLALGTTAKNVSAQASTSVLYVPLIGITSVPDPLTLPNGAGNVTYNYAVKNFLREVALTEIEVVDDKCSAPKYIEGDDNADSELDYGETWRYTCAARLTETTQSIATAIGHANDTTATHKAYTTVVVGGKDPAPLVSVINVTKVAYPLSLPAEGGQITFTYRVSNPGAVPLSEVTVVDNKCSTLAGKLGDTNGNNLLDIHEVWIYTCTAHLTQTTTNTVKVTALGNGLRALDEYSLTVHVENSAVATSPNFPDTGMSGNTDLKIPAWMVMSIILAILTTVFILTRQKSIIKKDGGK